MLHQVGVSFDLYYDARKHKIKKKYIYIGLTCAVEPACSLTRIASFESSFSTATTGGRQRELECLSGQRLAMSLSCVDAVRGNVWTVNTFM